jgi:DNA-binding transcriptional LysR family regulator
LLQKFCQSHPQVQLRVTALGSDRALKVLRDGLVDVALVMNNKYLTSSSEMVVKHLYREPIKVLTSNNHPLTQQKSVTIKDLAQYAQVIFKDGYGMQRIVQEIFASQGLDLEVAMELNTLDAFRGVIRQGNLIALLPALALKESLNDPTLAIIPIDLGLENNRQLTREVVLITTKDRLQIPTVKNFFNLIYDSNKTN